MLKIQHEAENQSKLYDGWNGIYFRAILKMFFLECERLIERESEVRFSPCLGLFPNHWNKKSHESRSKKRKAWQARLFYFFTQAVQIFRPSTHSTCATANFWDFNMHICCAIFFAIHWNSLCSQHSPLLVHFTFGTDDTTALTQSLSCFVVNSKNLGFMH